MNWNYTDKQPEDLISVRFSYGQPIATIKVLIDNVNLNKEMKFKYAELTLPNAEFDYDTIVNTIISTEYPSDKMQAVINNYLLDPSEEDTKGEFDTMQAFRKRAKEEAKIILAYDKKHKIWPLQYDDSLT